MREGDLERECRIECCKPEPCGEAQDSHFFAAVSSSLAGFELVTKQAMQWRKDSVLLLN